MRRRSAWASQVGGTVVVATAGGVASPSARYNWSGERISPGVYFFSSSPFHTMKRLMARLLWALAGLLLMLSLVTSSTEPQCNLYTLPGCPRNFNPVCGTDGETYANECMLCMTNREKDRDIQVAYKSACS